MNSTAQLPPQQIANPQHLGIDMTNDLYSPSTSAAGFPPVHPGQPGIYPRLLQSVSVGDPAWLWYCLTNDEANAIAAMLLRSLPSCEEIASREYDPIIHDRDALLTAWQLALSAAIGVPLDELLMRDAVPQGLTLWPGSGLDAPMQRGFDGPQGLLARGSWDMAQPSLGVASPSQPAAYPPASVNPAYGVYMPQAGVADAVGLRVQQANTFTPPAQPQGSPSGPDEASRSSSTIRATPAADVAEGRDVLAEGDDDEEEEDPKKPKVLFENTLIGRMCAERNITCNSPMPVVCWFCKDARENPKPSATKVRGGGKPAEVYDSWKSFKGHMRRCQNGPKEKPICHFCNEVRNAAGRPHQMARHLEGGGGDTPCGALQTLMRSGARTYGEVADWLKERKLAITAEFLGAPLATKLRAAAKKKNPVGRDELLYIVLRDPVAPAVAN